MQKRDRKRRERERRADEAFYDGLLLGHYWRETRSDVSHDREDHWGGEYPDDDFADEDDDFADEDLDMDDWD